MLAAASAHRAPAIAARAIPRCRLPPAGDGGPSRASSIRPVSIARSTCPDMAKTSVSASSTLVRSAGLDQVPGPGQRVLGAGQRADGQVTPPGLEQQRAGPGRVAGPLGQVGGQRAPPAGQARVGRLRRRQRPAGQHGPLRRQQPGQHRLVGQRVPEPEAVPLRHDQLQADAVAQRRDHGRVGQAGDRAEQRPVETAAQHRGRADDPAGLRAHAVQPPPDRVGERGRHPGSAQVGGVPAAVPLGQRPRPPPGRPAPPRPGTGCPRPARRRIRAPRPAGRRRPGRPGSCRPSPPGPGGPATARRRTRGPRARWPARRLRRPLSRRVARHSTRSAARLSARYSSSASVSWSAQCRSSRTSTQPACGARARSSRSTASPRKTGDSSPGTGCGRPPLGNQPPEHRPERVEFLAGRQAALPARPRSAPRRTAGTAWARRRPRPGRPAQSGHTRPPRGRSRGPAATCRCRPRRPGTPRRRDPPRPAPGRPAAGGLPRPARPGPGTAPAAQDQYRPGGRGGPTTGSSCCLRLLGFRHSVQAATPAAPVT